MINFFTIFLCQLDIVTYQFAFIPVQTVYKAVDVGILNAKFFEGHRQADGGKEGFQARDSFKSYRLFIG